MSSLGADIEWFRAEQARLFICDGIVERASSSPPVFDPNTGTYTPSDGTEVYQGPCSVRWATRQIGREVRSGEEELRFEGYVGKWPVDTPIAKDDVVTLSVSPYDPSLVGRPLRVVAVERDARQIARVAKLEEVVG